MNEQEYQQKTSLREDAPVLEFLDSLSKDRTYKYLEVGAGTGRFPLKIRDRNLDITCLEINKELAKKLKQNLKTIEGNILNTPFKDESFDILHCSHVIEHFGYPDITKVLDEMFRITKKGGYVIIRSPLMHPNFYNDIDHIRPYPPKTILQYFKNPQQQKTNNYNIKVIKTWRRKQTKEIRGFWYINKILKKMWILFNWPTGKANGYVAIFQKI